MWPLTVPWNINTFRYTLKVQCVPGCKKHPRFALQCFTFLLSYKCKTSFFVFLHYLFFFNQNTAVVNMTNTQHPPTQPRSTWACSSSHCLASCCLPTCSSTACTWWRRRRLATSWRPNRKCRRSTAAWSHTPTATLPWRLRTRQPVGMPVFYLFVCLWRSNLFIRLLFGFFLLLLLWRLPSFFCWCAFYSPQTLMVKYSPYFVFI